MGFLKYTSPAYDIYKLNKKKKPTPNTSVSLMSSANPDTGLAAQSNQSRMLY